MNRNPCVPATAAPIPVRAISPATGKIRICSFRPRPITARFPICGSPSPIRHMRQETGGWTRQVTVRELGVSKDIAGVNMRLNAGGVRELHWHKAAEWAYMLYGTARITAIDPQGRNFVDDVGVGDLWYFPSGVPHSIQGLNPDGCEFLLVFDDGDFDEDNTFLLERLVQAHAERGAVEEFRRFRLVLRSCSGSEPALYFPGAGTGAACLRQDRRGDPGAAEIQPQDDGAAADQDQERHGADHRYQRVPGFEDDLRRAGRGRARRHARVALASQHQRMAVLHRRPGAHGRVRGVGPGADLRFQAGDVGYVPFAMGHYIENTGTTPLRFLEVFKSSYYADVSLNQWLALTPPELVQAHLKLDPQTMAAFHKEKFPVVPGMIRASPSLGVLFAAAARSALRLPLAQIIVRRADRGLRA